MNTEQVEFRGEGASEQQGPTPEEVREGWSQWHELQKYSPSERDLEIFEAAVIQHRTQREVALEHQLSQTRVGQLVAQGGPGWAALPPGN